MILVLDNYDSFTYNLVQYVGELGGNPVVYRNDVLTPEEVMQLAPAGIIISPGPGTPAQAGISIPLVRAAAAAGVPLLGVCLGHQAIGAAFSGRIERADRLMHGKTTSVTHVGSDVFHGLPNPVTAMRYHSLVVSASAFPPELEMTAWSMDRPRGHEIMGLRHRTRPIFGVQFHPESVATEGGRTLLTNFLRLTAGFPSAVPSPLGVTPLVLG